VRIEKVYSSTINLIMINQQRLVAFVVAANQPTTIPSHICCANYFHALMETLKFLLPGM